MQLLVDSLHQQAANVGTERIIDLANAGRAGDVDFRQMLADHIQAYEQQAFFPQGRADLRGDPAIFLGQRTRFATATGGQVATGFTRGGNARQAVVHRFAVDHQDTFVTIDDGGQVALDHDLLLTVQGQGLEDHRQVRVARGVAENGRAAHAVQRLEDHVPVVVGEFAQHIRATADDGRRRALREQRGEQFFVAVTQALRLVDHQHASTLGLLQQIRGVDELHVERRILAHQDHVQITEQGVLLGFQLEPFFRIGEDLQRTHPRPGLAFCLVQVALFHIEQFPAALLRGQQHGQRAILFIGNAGNRVHDNPDANAHGCFLESRGVCVICRSEPAPGGVPTMGLRAPRFSSQPASSLTTIASRLAPTKDQAVKWRQSGAECVPGQGKTTAKAGR